MLLYPAPATKICLSLIYSNAKLSEMIATLRLYKRLLDEYYYSNIPLSGLIVTILRLNTEHETLSDIILNELKIDITESDIKH